MGEGRKVALVPENQCGRTLFAQRNPAHWRGKFRELSCRVPPTVDDRQLWNSNFPAVTGSPAS